MIEALSGAESAALLWIQANLRSPWLNRAMTAVTRLGDRGMLWIAVALALLCFKRTRRLGAVCALAMLLGAVAANLILKNLVARARPYEAIGALESLVGPQRDWSFPSGHTVNGFACAWVLFRQAPKKFGVPALAVAALIALSRLYVGVHYPTDVLCGIPVGLACAAAAMALARRIGAQRAGSHG